GAGAAVALRYREPRDADLAAQPAPQRPVVPGVSALLLRQQPADRIAQVAPLVGQLHARLPSAIAAITRARCSAWLPQVPARALASSRARPAPSSCAAQASVPASRACATAPATGPGMA